MPSRFDHHALLNVFLWEEMAAEAYEVAKEKMDFDGVAPRGGLLRADDVCLQQSW